MGNLTQKDLTVIYLTANQVPEKFARWQRQILIEAIGDTPLISVSRKPLDFGKNLLDTESKSVSNIYFQMLRAANHVKTEYIAIAEDDCLYPREHFVFRPDHSTFLYNQNRWALFTWGVPTYSWRNRKSNSTLIAPRELLIEALEERFRVWPYGTPDELTGELGRRMVEKNLRVTHRNTKEVFSEVSVIQLNHIDGSEDRARRHRKALGQMKCFDMYYWRAAEDITKRYA